MKSNVIERVLVKLRGFEQSGKAVEALEAIQTADHAPDVPPENDDSAKDIFAMVPAVDHRPDLPEQAMTFDDQTGLPCVAMTNFPMPRDEDEDDTADADLFA
jgi:hypothetical protein